LIELYIKHLQCLVGTQIFMIVKIFTDKNHKYHNRHKNLRSINETPQVAFSKTQLMLNKEIKYKSAPK
jgi:hypothetical protein